MPFMNFDLSQAETRVVAILSEDEELLSWFRDGIDPHARTAQYIFGGDENDYRKDKGKEPPERHIGKIGRHAYPYGTSPHKLMLEANTNARRFHINIQISEWRAKQIIKIMDEKCPAISQVYWPAIKAIAHSTRTIKTAHGRVRYFADRLNEDLYREMYSYIPQADVSDKTKFSMLKVKKKFPWLRIILEAHDAFCVDLPTANISEVAAYAKEIMEEPIDFSGCSLSRGSLIIPCDIEVGDNYKDLKKYRVE